MGLRRSYEEARREERPSQTTPLLRVQNLQKHFPIRQGLFRRKVDAIKVVNDVSFAVYPGETVAIVGGKASGKSMLGRTIMQLETSTGGRIYLNDQQLQRLRKKQLRQVRQQMGMLFQDPYASLSPHMRLREIIGEPLRIHQLEQSPQQVAKLLSAVGLNPYFHDRYPFEFSGGQRQRINIARVLATQPSIMVLDEPLAFLDPNVRLKIQELLLSLKTQNKLTYLWLTSSLQTALYVADRVGILYLGRLVEIGSPAELRERPLHPYTQHLFSTLPQTEGKKERGRQKISLPGQRQTFENSVSGCLFHPRCAYATEHCRRAVPEPREIPPAAAHTVACHHADQFLE